MQIQQRLKLAHSLVPRLESGTVWFNLHNFVFPNPPLWRLQVQRPRFRVGKGGRPGPHAHQERDGQYVPRRLPVVLRWRGGMQRLPGEMGSVATAGLHGRQGRLPQGIRTGLPGIPRAVSGAALEPAVPWL